MIYVFSFVIVFLIFIAMAIGVLLTDKPLIGSCGGLACFLCRQKKKCDKQLAAKEDGGGL